MEEGGFEPPKRIATDLQSAPFGHSGTPPYGLFAARSKPRRRSEGVSRRRRVSRGNWFPPGGRFPRAAGDFPQEIEAPWSWWTDSNPRPADYKSAALPTELHQRISSSTAGVILSERRCFVKGKSCYFHIFSGRGRNYPHTGVDRPAAGRAAGMAGGLLPPVPGGAVRRGAGPVPPVPRAPFPGETGEAGGYL